MITAKEMTQCAACGKDGDGLKTCTACKLVKYCNATCQKAHRPQHKKECKKRAAELHDEALFKQPPPREECPICMLTLPILLEEQRFQACCGKVICMGCFDGTMKAAGGEDPLLCPFCRALPASSGGEEMKLLNKRVEANDAIAIK